MAAYAALVSVMQIIHQIENHPSPPISLSKKQVKSLTEIVTFLQEFLEAYKSPVADLDEADPLEMRIADAAYAAEDVLESYIVDAINLSRSTDTHDRETTSSSGEEINHGLYQVIQKMDLIKKDAMKIVVDKAEVHDERQRMVSTTPAGSSSILKDSMIMGFDEILNKLTEDQLSRQTIPITGMGGIGKTTLARKIFEDAYIKEHFVICAWTTISQQYDTIEIISQLLSQVIYIKKEELSEDELGLELYQNLFGRKFLIVLDDMWCIDAWDKIRHFFPDNGNGSRVLVTTRLSQLSSQLNHEYRHQMEFLDEVSSWKLFSKTVFGEKSCPLELEETGKKIVENCIGLPLTIIVVGGLLKKMKYNIGRWESIWENLSSIVNLDKDKHCFKLLKMSYNHLPVYLKPCFLYMGVFEEDDEIGVSELIKLWVSEGFLKPESGKSLETTAKEHFHDLVDRNLILVHEVTHTGSIKKCKMHDLLRDLCVREAHKDRFYHVIGEDYSINSHLRRVVIPDSTSEEEIVDALQSMSRARSIICDDYDKVIACRRSKLLRTLNASDNQLDESDGRPLVFQFVNLRHVVGELHSNLSLIKHLWNLQTLIVSCWFKCKAPVVIWKMPQLRHVEFKERKLHLPDPPSGGDAVIMESLHTLKGVKNFKFGEEVVKRIPNITRLLVEYNKVERNRGSSDDHYCLSNIASLSKLESLNYIEGRRIHRVQKLTFPHSIKKLTLTMSYDDYMLEKLGSLPLLQKLKMICGSFKTGKWEIVEGQFPHLKSLTLFWCSGLKQWTTEDGKSSIFPCLEKLSLSRLTALEEIPSEIGEITTLQTIDLLNCSESVVRCVRNIVDEQEENQGEVDFRVSVVVRKRFEGLKSLTTPNFEVEVTDYV